MGGVSVVIPAHDEASTIGDVVAACLRHTPDLDEVVVVDDGSRDETAARARAAGARVVALPANRGKGHALRVGFQHTRSERVVVLDADGQDDPAEIADLLGALRDDIDLVIGSRFLGTFEPGAITPLNRAGTVALAAVMNALFGTRITDPIAGFRAFRRPLLDQLDFRATRYDVEMDMLLDLLGRGGRVVEIPVRRAPRRQGASKLGPIRDGSRILWTIVRHRLRRARRRV
jgi:glycosyltransferase involved in cell wall biosynthesis